MVALMAAMIFVVTSFVRIPIEVPPAGETMLKVANVLCLLAGMWFGGVRGGLAAGIGSMLFDLSNPKYVASAPFTLLFFFMMAFICGTICLLYTSFPGGKCLRRIRRRSPKCCIRSVTLSASAITRTI